MMDLPDWVNNPETQHRFVYGTVAMFIRDEVRCHVHPHTTVTILTPDGPSTQHGPVCELIDVIPCPIRDRHRQCLHLLYEAIGTNDLSEFVV